MLSFHKYASDVLQVLFVVYRFCLASDILSHCVPVGHLPCAIETVSSQSAKSYL